MFWWVFACKDRNCAGCAIPCEDLWKPNFGLWKKQKSIEIFELWCCEDSWEDHWTAKKTTNGSSKQPTKSSHSGQNDQAQILQLWTPYRRSSWKRLLILGKEEGERRGGWPSGSWRDSIIVPTSAPLKITKDQFEGQIILEKIYPCGCWQATLMAPNQLINQLINARPNSFQKPIMLGKVEGKRWRGQPPTKKVDSVTAVMGPPLESLKDQFQE